MVSSMSMSDTSAIVAQLNSLTTNVPKDEESRKKLLEATRGLSLALENQGDTIQRICYLVVSYSAALFEFPQQI